MRILISFLLLALCGNAQPFERNRLTFSGGWAVPVSGQLEGAPVLGFTYGYRFHRYMEAEAGLLAAIRPGPEVRGANYDFQNYDRMLWVPFGIRFVAPLRQSRVELSAGGGALYERYSSNGSFLYGYDGWGGYLVGSASVALDRGRHFWLGAAPRFLLANPQYRRDRWFTITGEVSFRF